MGKTTIARILAKALNCLNPQGEEPCGECENCKAIAKGSFPDLIEIDAASNRGIDDIRSLKESVAYAPIKGKYKVYIIDEAHMLTKEAFNALLKTLEEPPPRTVFILCTTELDKIIPTIQSRCQRIIFKKLPHGLIVEKLKEICQKENISYEEEALRVIANASEGCMRDAASILDQAAIYCDNNIMAQKVREFLGIVSKERIEEFLKALLQGNTAYCLKELQQIEEQGYNLLRFWEELYSLVFNELLNRKLNQGHSTPLGGQPLEKLLYLEQILSKALSEAKFKEPLRVFQLAVLKTELLKDVIPLSEALKLLKSSFGGQSIEKSTNLEPVPQAPGEEKGEKPQRETIKELTPKGERERKETPPQREKETKKPPQAQATAKEGAVKPKKIDFINRLYKEEIIAKPLIGVLSKYIRETEEGLLVEVPQTTYRNFEGEFEKLKRYYGKHVQIKVKEEVKNTEKKFQKIKNTRYLF